MDLTALVCDNGWTAIYGPDGKRLATYGPGAANASPLLAQLSNDPSVTVALKYVTADPKYQDFPATV